MWSLLQAGSGPRRCKLARRRCKPARRRSQPGCAARSRLGAARGSAPLQAGSAPLAAGSAPLQAGCNGSAPLAGLVAARSSWPEGIQIKRLEAAALDCLNAGNAATADAVLVGLLNVRVGDLLLSTRLGLFCSDMEPILRPLQVVLMQHEFDASDFLANKTNDRRHCERRDMLDETSYKCFHKW